MKHSLVAAILAAALAAPAIAAPPAKSRIDPPGVQKPLPRTPPDNGQFDLRTAPQLDDNVAPPPRESLKGPFYPFRRTPDEQERFRLCALREVVVLSQCEFVRPRGEPKLYLLSPNLRAYSSASKPMR